MIYKSRAFLKRAQINTAIFIDICVCGLYLYHKIYLMQVCANRRNMFWEKNCELYTACVLHNADCCNVYE